MLIPPKLKTGDEIRVIAPSRSMKPIKKVYINRAVKFFTDKGFKVTFGKHIMPYDKFKSSPIKPRIEDLHAAFKDKKVKAVFAAIGGTTSNQLLKYIDYSLIKNNPKIFCGLSDITCLSNAIYAKTGLMTYSGSHLPNFGANKCVDYTWEYFEKCFISNKPFQVLPSERYCESKWKVKTSANKKHWLINQGEATGTALGGNLLTFTFLQGSEYAPELKNSIIFMEDTGKETFRDFQNQLQSIIIQKGAKGIKGIVVGRFQKGTEMTPSLLSKIVKSKAELKNVPVLGNVDFGHTTPTITFPIGGKVKLSVKKNSGRLDIITH